MQEKPVTPPAQAKAATATMAFPHELRKHFYDTADWTSIIFLLISLTINLLGVGVAATREWKDPSANLTNEQLMAMQDRLMNTFKPVEVKVEDMSTAEQLENLINNPEFEQALAQQQANLTASLQSTLAEAQATLASLDQATAGGAAGADVQGQLNDILGSLGDIGGIGGADAGGPSLDLAPTDVAIFAEGAGSGSRVVSGAIDVAALGSSAKISASFTRGGLSSGQAARLSQQIAFARERLGGNVQLKVGTGLGGGNRRAMLRVASGGKTGQRIAIEQLALPPARAAGPGGRDQDAVEVQASRTRQLIGGCYSIGLAVDRRLAGVVVVRFTINPNGSVTGVRVSKSNLGNRDVEECIVAAVQTWKFASGSSTDTFEYPFSFEPG
jgi:TonB family protein